MLLIYYLLICSGRNVVFKISKTLIRGGLREFYPEF